MINEKLEFNLRKNISSDINHLFFFAHGFIFSSILFSGLELNIFELLSNTHKNVDILSKELGVATPKLEPLLIALFSMGLLSRDDEARYTNTALSQACLTAGGPASLRLLFLQMKRHIYDVFSYLPESILSGEPQFQQLKFLRGEAPLQSCYEGFARHPDEYRLLLQVLNATSAGVGALISEQAELHRSRHLLDLGGGGGQIACDIAERNPSLAITIADLPIACDFAEKIIESRNLSTQIKCVRTDITKELPDTIKYADTILLAGVISDFNNENRNKILSQCKTRLLPNGRILISETLFNDDKTGPLLTAILALYMTVTTGGGNFSSEEIKKILAELNYQDIQIFQNGALGARDLITARVSDFDTTPGGAT